MHIIIYSFDLTLTEKTIIALLGFAQWLIIYKDSKKKNPPQHQ
jgi:hypothetical protein